MNNFDTNDIFINEMFEQSFNQAEPEISIEDQVTISDFIDSIPSVIEHLRQGTDIEGMMMTINSLSHLSKSIVHAFSQNNFAQIFLDLMDTPSAQFVFPAIEDFPLMDPNISDFFIQNGILAKLIPNLLSCNSISNKLLFNICQSNWISRAIVFSTGIFNQSLQILSEDHSVDMELAISGLLLSYCKYGPICDIKFKKDPQQMPFKNIKEFAEGMPPCYNKELFLIYANRGLDIKSPDIQRMINILMYSSATGCCHNVLDGIRRIICLYPGCYSIFFDLGFPDLLETYEQMGVPPVDLLGCIIGLFYFGDKDSNDRERDDSMKCFSFAMKYMASPNPYEKKLAMYAIVNITYMENDLLSQLGNDDFFNMILEQYETSTFGVKKSVVFLLLQIIPEDCVGMLREDVAAVIVDFLSVASSDMAKRILKALKSLFRSEAESISFGSLDKNESKSQVFASVGLEDQLLEILDSNEPQLVSIAESFLDKFFNDDNDDDVDVILE